MTTSLDHRAEARLARLRACTLLIVDDEAANLDLLEGLLDSAGYSHVVRTLDAREVVALVEGHNPDLILLDLNMPHRHGLEVLADLRAVTPEDAYRPVLVLTADVTWEARERALTLGARDFVTKPFDAAEVLLRVENLLEARVLHGDEARARARAEEATRERERLLAVVAHDLRNPLAVVSMYAETLLLQAERDAARINRGPTEQVTAGRPEGDGAGGTAVGDEAEWTCRALSTIHANAVTMQRLVEDLLDASTLRGVGFRVHRTPQRVGEVFDVAERMLRPLAESAGVHLVVQADGDAAQRVGAIDRERVVQLLSNLVGNAVKFTPHGGQVVVSYALREGVLHGAVLDEGPGIPAEELPHLFSAFWRGESRGVRTRASGAGLGLWIARGIAEAHGGSLVAESQVGEGATFRFSLEVTAPS